MILDEGGDRRDGEEILKLHVASIRNFFRLLQAVKTTFQSKQGKGQFGIYYFVHNSSTQEGLTSTVCRVRNIMKRIRPLSCAGK